MAESNRPPMQEIRKKALERVKAQCKVCPVCNGIACAGKIPGMGGLGSGVSFQNNVSALARHHLALRTLHQANEPDTKAALWGREMALPVLAAPVGSVALNLGSDMSDVDYTRFVLRGCRAAQTLAGIGDLPAKADFQKYMDVVGDDGAIAVPFIKPWDNMAEITARMDMAVTAGIGICGMDVDGAGLPTMRKLASPVAVTPPAKLEKIVAEAHKRGMKFIVKGVMTTDEAVIAADAGADAVVVSNHGGRALDCAPGAADVLPSIAGVVGERLIVMMDGGVRSGVDVLKALALGAKFVLICRPVLIAVHGDEEHGVPTYFAQIQDQLVQAMRLTGCADLRSISGRVLC